MREEKNKTTKMRATDTTAGGHHARKCFVAHLSVKDEPLAVPETQRVWVQVPHSSFSCPHLPSFTHAHNPRVWWSPAALMEHWVLAVMKCVDSCWTTALACCPSTLACCRLWSSTRRPSHRQRYPIP